MYHEHIHYVQQGQNELKCCLKGIHSDESYSTLK